ncbi:hypothetical protein [Actinomadura rugatobispora]|uniref:Uncharacterized protein n=1 Tax=Actinomadura rugatobispora TaxID=1994 RepID=A0ABW1A493_9ACTN|nr:hypothetical protein GCM10010200_062220 [Actinomadura rugatobispora]
MLRLQDHRTGQALELPPNAMHVHVHSGRERALVTADLLRRLAERSRRRVTLTRAAQVRPKADFSELNLPEVEVATEGELPGGAIWVGSEDVLDHRCLIVPPERYTWDELAESASTDPLCVRLAILRERYREPDEMDGDLVVEAGRDLAHWREAMAEWATRPGRPMDRPYATKAEAALADDLDSPTALAVLDDLTADPDVAPGAKLETVIHLDLILGLDLVSGIGRA